MVPADSVALNLWENDVRKLSKDRGEPDWLLEKRLGAFKAFKSLPVETSEIFKKYSDVSGVDWKSFAIPDAQSKKILAVPDFISGNDGINFLQSDGPTVKARLNGAVGKGVVLEDWQAALDRHPEIAKKALLVNASPFAKFSALNFAFFNSGFMLYVPDGTDAGTVRTADVIGGAGAIHVGFDAIIAGRESKASVVKENYSIAASGGQTLSSQFSKITANEGAQVSFSAVQALDGNTVSLSGCTASLSKDAALSSSQGHFGGLLAISTSDVFLQGDGARAEDSEIAFGSSSQRFSTASNLFHRARSTTGKVTARSAFKDAARGLFKGTIDIGEKASGASAYLAGHAVLLDNEASADAIPALKIENNDVRATHSASVAQLDEEKIFYLMTRGLPEEGAKRLAVRGFLEPVLRLVREPAARTKLLALVELKLAGNGIEKMQEAVKTVAEEEQSALQTNERLFEGHYKYR